MTFWDSLKRVAFWLRVAAVFLAAMFAVLAIHWFGEGEIFKAWADVMGAIACCLLYWFIWKGETTP